MKTLEQQVADLTSVLEVTEQMHQKAQAEHRAVRAERDRLKAALDEAIECAGLYLGVRNGHEVLRGPIGVFSYARPNLTAYLREREADNA